MVVKEKGRTREDCPGPTVASSWVSGMGKRESWRPCSRVLGAFLQGLPDSIHWMDLDGLSCLTAL